MRGARADAPDAPSTGRAHRLARPAILARARALPVRYVIVDESRTTPEQARAACQSPDLVEAGRFGNRVVYRLAPAAIEGS